MEAPPCPFSKRPIAMNQPPEVWAEIAHDSHAGRLGAMLDIATGAGEVTLRYFRQNDLRVESKADDSPVTIADRSAEQWAREQIAQRFPDDAVVGEEFSDSAGTSRYRWVIDPIDGTKSFVCGVPLYSTLLALECDGQPLGGVIQIPALGETVIAAVGQGAWYRSSPTGAWTRAKVSEKSTLDSSVLLTSQSDLFGRRGAGDAFADLERICWVSRTWGDGYGYLLVATGRAELMVDAICNPWDVAAMLPILSEAGGRFTDWRGNETCRGGEGLGSNGRIHDEVVSILAPHSPPRPALAP
jgi:histidinol phosphatase-like enzyme (inositol monophosphatase family)